MLSPLMYISQSQKPGLLQDELMRILDYGVELIQLRIKNTNNLSNDQFIGMYKDSAEWASKCFEPYGAQLIINDKVEVAQHVDALGVHLGRNDQSIKEARVLLGSEKMIGGTANTSDDINAVLEAGANYIGLGPLRFTETKKDLSPLIGFSGYRELLNKDLTIPVFAIGGVVLKDIRELKDIGLHGIAVSGLIYSKGSKEMVQSIKDTFSVSVLSSGRAGV